MEYKKNVDENAMKLNINETYCKKEGIIKSYNKREELRKLKLKQKASGIHFHFKLTIYNLPGWIIFGSPSAVIKNTTCNTCVCFCLRALEQSLDNFCRPQFINIISITYPQGRIHNYGLLSPSSRSKLSFNLKVVCTETHSLKSADLD